MPNRSGSQSSKFFLVLGEDWEGLYLDGKLMVEGHQLTPADVLAIFGIRLESRSCDQQWLEDEGSLPIELGDVKFV